jgi:hypothetical protein
MEITVVSGPDSARRLAAQLLSGISRHGFKRLRVYKASWRLTSGALSFQ